MGLWTKQQQTVSESGAEARTSLGSSSLHKRRNTENRSDTTKSTNRPRSRSSSSSSSWADLQNVLTAGTVTAEDEDHISEELKVAVETLFKMSNLADQWVDKDCFLENENNNHRNEECGETPFNLASVEHDQQQQQERHCVENDNIGPMESRGRNIYATRAVP